ncbi:riboflavin synthase [Aquisalimonas sp.]|uniref:riboflavin synthase n=1 Tax=Aquisalimonas sp. TaxID=1872621 RepID=UPI0025B7C6BF|nr:riboflavin synthase [Aquisalimonas sp.]
MFTGIIQAVGEVAALERRGDDVRLRLRTGDLPRDAVAIGDSIAVNGVCLTAVELPGDGLAADVSVESLRRTSLGQLDVGSRVNLETALTPSTPLGGHLVSGHVDGLGTVEERSQEGRSWRFVFRAPDRLARYIAEKGSICIDGVSLTVNGVDGAQFEVNIVPHTMDATRFGEYRPGQSVNLEVDVIARYLERLMLGDKAAEPGSAGITRELLARNGFRAD